MKRTPLRRKSPLRTRARINPRSTKRSRPPGYEDPDYLAWLRLQDCRVSGCCSVAIEAHHLRFDEHGNALGARLKDDRRAISMCRQHHTELHSLSGYFHGWERSILLLWQDDRSQSQCAEYLATHPGEESA